MKLEIDILSDPNKFVNEWSQYYDYGNTELYSKNINSGLSCYDNFLDLFRWKNGIYNISKNKRIVIEQFWSKIQILKKLRKSFDWELFEKEFEPDKSSTIWKIFLLHIIDPYNFPIFDVHVFRFHHFIINGIIEEIPSSQNLKYKYYKELYRKWFLLLRDKHSLDPKKMDESFFKFGQILKPLRGLPISLKEH